MARISLDVNESAAELLTLAEEMRQRFQPIRWEIKPTNRQSRSITSVSFNSVRAVRPCTLAEISPGQGSIPAPTGSRPLAAVTWIPVVLPKPVC